MAARIGGDEFVVFLAEDGEADRFERSFEETLLRLNGEEDRTFAVTASVGTAVRKLNEMDTIERCIQQGDREMYRVKEARHMKRTD